MTPQYQNPIPMGVDIVIHSATKFLNGHSDVVLGMIVTDDEDLYKEMKKQQIILGALPGVEECWLVFMWNENNGNKNEQEFGNGFKNS